MISFKSCVERTDNKKTGKLHSQSMERSGKKTIEQEYYGIASTSMSNAAKVIHKRLKNGAPVPPTTRPEYNPPEGRNKTRPVHQQILIPSEYQAQTNITIIEILRNVNDFLILS